jgi:hypothetical protein
MWPMQRGAAASTMPTMQYLLIPPPAHASSAGHSCCFLPAPGLPGPEQLALHTLAAGAEFDAPAVASPALLALVDGQGKAALDGAVLRLAAPCVLRWPPATALRLINHGAVPLRWLLLPLPLPIPSPLTSGELS